MILSILEKLLDMKAYQIFIVLLGICLFSNVFAEKTLVEMYFTGKTGLIMVDQMQVISLGSSCRGVSLRERVSLVTTRLKRIFESRQLEARKLSVVVEETLVGLTYRGKWLITADQVTAQHYHLSRKQLAEVWRENILNAWVLSKRKFKVIKISRGLASWYGAEFRGCRTASGDLFNETIFTAAHRSLPFGTEVKVTNLQNQRVVMVTINDRGPWVGRRIIDLSWGAARALGITGVARVKIEVIKKQC